MSATAVGPLSLAAIKLVPTMVLRSFKIVVTPESTKVKRELNNYVWNDKKASIPLSNGYDHYINAMEYAFERLTKGSIHVS